MDFGSAGARLRYSSLTDDERRRLLNAIGNLSELNPELYLPPSSVRQQEESVDIYFQYEQRLESVASLRNKLSRAVLPAYLKLVETQFRLLSNWYDPPLLPPIPCLMRAVVGQSAPWRLIPVPQLDLSLDKWAASDPEAWNCLNPKAVLEQFDPDDSYLCAATLHSLLAGPHISSRLSQWHGFRRLIQNRIEPQSMLGQTISQIVPATFEQEATEIRSFIAGYMIDSTDRCSEAADAFSDVLHNLSLQRLVARWRRERQDTVADALQAEHDRFSGAQDQAAAAVDDVIDEPPPYQEEEPWEPPPESAYDDISPVESPEPPPDSGLPPVLDRMLHQIPEEGHGAVRKFLGLVQHFASMETESRETVTSAIALLRQTISTVPDEKLLDESTDLQIAHISARYLNVDESKLSILRAPLTSTWNQAVAAALKARLGSTGKAYNQTSGLCRAGRQLIQTMPQHGGSAGNYLSGYLHLLDGIAHIGGAGAYKDNHFYADAFDQLRQAHDAARRINSVHLSEAAVAWLKQLHRVTAPLANTSSAAIHIGVSAFTSTLGIAVKSYDVVIPEIPWYEDSVIFPA